MAIGNQWTNVASKSVSRGAATITFYIDVKLNRQDTTGNYSVVDTRLTSTISGSAGGSGYRFTLTGSNGISGSAVWTFENETILTGQTTIYHNDDGTKVGNASAYCYNGYLSIEESFNGNFELPTIARASTPTISPSSTFNIGDTITINTNRKASNFTHTLSLTFGNYTYQIGTNIEESVTLDTSTIASNLYQETTTAASKNGTLTCVTYNGTTQIGTKDVSFTAKVVNSNPTYTETYEDVNPTTSAITQDTSLIIRNNSILKILITNAEAKNYATLSSLTAIIEGVTYQGSLSGTSGYIDIGTLNISSNIIAQVILTDSRGISTTKNITITILDWQVPTAIINLQRQNNFYSETDINVDANYSSLDGKNTILIKVRSKKVGDSTWGSYTTLQDNVTSTINLDNNYQWNVQVYLEDRLANVVYNLTIDRGIPILFIDRIKRSLGIDCFPTDDTSIEVNGENILTRIAGYGQIANQVTGDWNTACGTASGFYMGQNLSHSPVGTTYSGWWWVIHIVHSANYQRQVAYSFLNNNEVYTRIMNNGTWGNWSLLNGKEYSSAETLIGKWVDGKPIYRKVLRGLTTPSTANAWTSVATLSNVDELIRMDCWFFGPDGRKMQSNFSQPSYEFAISFINGNIEMRPCTDYWRNRSCWVVVEYTKTTD